MIYNPVNMRIILFLSIALLSISCSKEKEQEKEKVEVKVERTCKCTDSVSGVTVSFAMAKNTLANHQKECGGKSEGPVTCQLE